MAACSSGVARPAVSSITETRYCISDHLLRFGLRSVAPHLDLPIAGLRPLGDELERHVEVGGLDDPEAAEVLFASNVGGSWPYGWNRSVVWCVTYVSCSGRAWPFRTAGGRWAGRPGSSTPSGWFASRPGRALCPGRCRGTAACPGR